MIKTPYKYIDIYSKFVLIVILFFILYINVLMPLAGEDFSLSQPITQDKSLHWLLDRMIRQYTTWISRIGDQIAIIFLYFNKWLFNIVNTLAFVYFSWLACFFAMPKKSIKVKYVVIISCLIILILPKFGDIFIWLTGSSNYLFPFLLLMTYFAPWRNYSERYDNVSWVYILLYMFLSFVAGMTNENTVPAVLVACFVLNLIFYFKHHIISWIRVVSTFALLIGFLFMVLSPTTAHRIAYYSNAFKIPPASTERYLNQLIKIVEDYFISSFAIVILFVASLIVLVYLKKKIKDFLFLSVMFLCSCISLGILMFAPYFEIRSFLFVWFSVLSVFIYVISRLDAVKPNYNSSSVILILLSILLFVNMPKYMREYYQFNKENSIRNEKLLNNTTKDSIIDVEFFNTKSSRIIKTGEDFLIGYNAGYSEFYGVKKIIMTMQINIDDANVINTTACMGKIDSINQYDLNSENINISKELNVFVWVTSSVNSKKLPENAVVLLEKNKNERYFYKTIKRNREDVAKYFKNKSLESSGFKANIDMTGYQGDYILKLGYYENEIIKICPEFKAKLHVYNEVD